MSTQAINPMPGDIVVCTSGELLGRFAYITGAKDAEQASVRASFDSRPFFDGEKFSCSGGIIRDIETGSLISTEISFRASFELCELGYSLFPNGEILESVVNVWEFHDSVPGVYPGPFLVEDVLKRPFIKYVFEPKESSSPLFKNKTEDGYIEKAIFSAAKSFNTFSWHKHSKPQHFGYIYTVSYGLDQLAGFNNKLSFDQFIKSFGLELFHVEEHCGYILPNMNVEDWSPLGWRRLIYPD